MVNLKFNIEKIIKENIGDWGLWNGD